ncbi:class F sortase [Phytohabitans rumicis]|uniref:Class F sortase n=1 Tax=Phytohabitans rumicis TaxID=1076125 RepID=A0A6V8LE58_9ACTN|nr:class F sortase [Phytohabitans rumicis]GFJ94584.1 class F sortase [Phytohabitans rumicis]
MGPSARYDAGPARRFQPGVGRRPVPRLGPGARPGFGPGTGAPPPRPPSSSRVRRNRLIAWLLVAVLAGWGVTQIRSATAAPAGPPALAAPAATGAPAPVVREAPEPDRVPAGMPIWRAPALDRSVPTKIAIPSINLRAWVDQIGLLPDGTIETPPYETAHRASWYAPGPAPGEPGSAVVVGHVDSKKAVAVFWYLARIQPGDPIEVTREDGRTAVFTVSTVERFTKTAFPTDRVYADVDVPVLRLVTCGGQYEAGRYTDNVIVFASMTETH